MAEWLNSGAKYKNHVLPLPLVSNMATDLAWSSTAMDQDLLPIVLGEWRIK